MAGPLNKNYFTTGRRSSANTVGNRYQLNPSTGDVVLIPPLANQGGVPGDNERREYNEIYGPGYREVDVRNVNGVNTVSASNFKPNATGANYAIYDDSQGYRTIGPLGLIEAIIDPRAEKIRDENYQNPNTDNIVSMGYGNGEVDPRLASAAGYSKKIEPTAGDFTFISGRGSDAYGNFGVLGDLGGKIGNYVGITDYGGDAKRRMEAYKAEYPNTVGKTYAATIPVRAVSSIDNDESRRAAADPNASSFAMGGNLAAETRAITNENMTDDEFFAAMENDPTVGAAVRGDGNDNSGGK